MSLILYTNSIYVYYSLHIVAIESLSLSSSTVSVLVTLGAMIRAGRLDRGMSQAELGQRLGVSRHTVIALEKGEPRVGVGTVFEAATIVGIPLLASNDRELDKLATTVANLTSILPERSRRKKVALDDDF